MDKGAVFSGPHRAAASRGKAAVTCPYSFREPALKPMERPGMHQNCVCLLKNPERL